MKPTQRLLPLALASLMAACATQPVSQPTHSSPAAALSSTLPRPPIAEVKAPSPALPEAAALPPVSHEATTVWEKLRGSFAMPDCDADPRIMAWAHRYTQNPQRFETQMQNALSQVVYVQQVAQKYDVAGEFVLLPWVESQYQAVPGHRDLPAGMWQLVRSTARVIGLHMDHSYDGRLDTSASTERVMRMLKDYHDQLHDWRLVDYAYNRGEFGVQRLIQQHGLPPEEPAIPKLPVPRVTREHLTKLLALACVVRNPSKFNVELPTLPLDQHLETVDIGHGMTLSNAADHAGMDTESLKRLNPAFQSNYLGDNTPGQLLMPRRNAEQLRNAMQTANGEDMTASISNPGDAPTALLYAAAPNDKSVDVSAPPVSQRARTHVVRPGESLWQIAHHYSTSVESLERINHLHGKMLKIGQILKLGAPEKHH